MHYKSGWAKNNPIRLTASQLIKKIPTLNTTLAPAIALCLFVAGCSGSRIVQPLNKGQWQTAVAGGGPIVDGDDGALPLALSSASVAYGFSQQTTGYVGMGLTSSIHDVYHMDIGFTHELITPFDYQPGITLSPALNLFRDKAGLDTTYYPQLDVNAYWLGAFRQDIFYIGLSNWFELSTTKAHDQKQNQHWIPTVHGGYTFQWDRWGLNLEMKYIAPTKNNENKLIDYVGIENQGVIATYLSISRKFR